MKPTWNWTSNVTLYCQRIYIYVYIYIYECSSKTTKYFIIHLRTISNEINMLDWKLASYHHIDVTLTHSTFYDSFQFWCVCYRVLLGSIGRSHKPLLSLLSLVPTERFKLTTAAISYVWRTGNTTPWYTTHYRGQNLHRFILRGVAIFQEIGCIIYLP